MDHQENKFSFLSDGNRLNGFLHLPGFQNNNFLVIGSHGLMANCDSPKQLALAKQCTTLGIAYFRFDFRGCGKSEGVFNLSSCLEERSSDLMNAASAMRSFFKNNLLIALFGSSMGGTVSLHAASRILPHAIITFAAPVMSSTIIRAEDPSQDKLSFNISDRLGKIRNILIFHGDADEVVPFSNARTIYESSKPRKKLIIQKGGDHRMSDKQHQKEFVSQSILWLTSFLPKQMKTKFS